MGYYTSFELTWSGSGPAFERFTQEGVDEPFTTWNLTPNDLASADSMKWYDWPEDMQALSAKWPTVLFELHGEGEENDDIWTAWYRNGKGVTVKATVVIEKPDLDTVIPPAHAASIDEEVRAEQRKAIQDKINTLTAKLDVI